MKIKNGGLIGILRAMKILMLGVLVMATFSIVQAAGLTYPQSIYRAVPSNVSVQSDVVSVAGVRLTKILPVDVKLELNSTVSSVVIHKNDGTTLTLLKGVSQQIYAAYDFGTNNSILTLGVDSASVGMANLTISIMDTVAIIGTTKVQYVVSSGGIILAKEPYSNILADGTGGVNVVSDMIVTSAGRLDFSIPFQIEVLGRQGVVMDAKRQPVTPVAGTSKYNINTTDTGVLNFNFTPNRLLPPSTYDVTVLKISAMVGTATGEMRVISRAPSGDLALVSSPIRRNAQALYTVSMQNTPTWQSTSFFGTAGEPEFYAPFDQKTVATGLYDAMASVGTITYDRAGKNNDALNIAGNEVDYPLTGVGQNVLHKFDKNRGAMGFWLKPNFAGTDNIKRDFVSITGATGAMKIFRDVAGRVNFQLSSGGNSVVVQGSTSDWVAGQWYHVAVVWTGQVIYLYLDGVLQAQAVVPSALFSTVTFDQLRVGSLLADASIDDLMLYVREIGENEVKFMANNAYVANIFDYNLDFDITNGAGFTLTNVFGGFAVLTNLLKMDYQGIGIDVVKGLVASGSLNLVARFGDVRGLVPIDFALLPFATLTNSNYLPTATDNSFSDLDKRALDENVAITNQQPTAQGSVDPLVGAEKVTVYANGSTSNKVVDLAGAERLVLDFVKPAAIYTDFSNWNQTVMMVGTAVWQALRERGAVYFAGAGDYLQLPDSEALSIDEGSFAVWVSVDDFSAPRAIFDKSSTVVDGSYALVTDSNVERIGNSFRPFVWVAGLGWKYGSIDFTPIVGQWYYVVFTYDAGNGAFQAYVDGVAYPVIFNGTTASFKGKIKDSTSALQIGSSTRTGIGDLQGYLSSLKIFNRVLTPVEIMALYQDERLTKLVSSVIDPFGNWLGVVDNVVSDGLVKLKYLLSSANVFSRQKNGGNMLVNKKDVTDSYSSVHGFDIANFGVTINNGILAVVDGSKYVFTNSLVKLSANRSVDLSAFGVDRVPTSIVWQYRAVNTDPWSSTLANNYFTTPIVAVDKTLTFIAGAVSGTTFQTRAVITFATAYPALTGVDDCGDTNAATFCAIHDIIITSAFPVSNPRVEPAGCGFDSTSTRRAMVRLLWDPNLVADNISKREVVVTGGYYEYGVFQNQPIILTNTAVNDIMLLVDEGKEYTITMTNVKGLDRVDKTIDFTAHYCDYHIAAAQLTAANSMNVPLVANTIDYNTVKIMVGDHKLPFPADVVAGAGKSEITGVVWELQRNGETVDIQQKDFKGLNNDKILVNLQPDVAQNAVVRSLVYDDTKVGGTGISLVLDHNFVKVRGYLFPTKGVYNLDGYGKGQNFGIMSANQKDSTGVSLSLKINYPFASIRGRMLSKNAGWISFNKEDGATPVVVDLRTGVWTGQAILERGGFVNFNSSVNSNISLSNASGLTKIAGNIFVDNIGWMSLDLSAKVAISFNEEDGATAIVVDPITKQLSGQAYTPSQGLISFATEDGAKVVIDSTGFLQGIAKSVNIGDVIFGTGVATAVDTKYALVDQSAAFTNKKVVAVNTNFMNPNVYADTAFIIDNTGVKTGDTLYYADVNVKDYHIKFNKFAADGISPHLVGKMLLKRGMINESFDLGAANVKLDPITKILTGAVNGTNASILNLSGLVMDRFGFLQGQAKITLADTTVLNIKFGNLVATKVFTSYALIINNNDFNNYKYFSNRNIYGDTVFPALTNGSATWGKSIMIYNTQTNPNTGIKMIYDQVSSNTLMSGSMTDGPFSVNFTGGNIIVNKDTKLLSGRIPILNSNVTGTNYTLSFNAIDGAAVAVDSNGNLQGTATVFDTNMAKVDPITFGTQTVANITNSYSFTIFSTFGVFTTQSALMPVYQRDVINNQLTKKIFSGFALCDGPATSCTQNGLIANTKATLSNPPKSGSRQSYKLIVHITYTLKKENQLIPLEKTLSFSTPAIVATTDTNYKTGVKAYYVNKAQTISSYYLDPGYAYDKMGGYFSYNPLDVINTIQLGLTIDNASRIIGKMYSKNIGWVSFDLLDGATVQVDPATGRVSGVAKIKGYGDLSFNTSDGADISIIGSSLVGTAISKQLGIIRFGILNVQLGGSCPNQFVTKGGYCVYNKY